MIILASSKPGYALTSGSHEIQCIYDAIFKFLSKKLLPLYTNVTKREQDNSFSDWTLMFHDDSVEKILIQNESKLRDVWNMIKIGESCTNVQSMLQLFKSYKPKLIIEEASDWAILHAIGILPPP